MTRHRWVAWAIALMVIVSLFGPTVSGAMAQDDEVDDPSADVVETIDEETSGEEGSTPGGEAVIDEPVDPPAADEPIGEGVVEEGVEPDADLLPSTQGDEDVVIAATANFSIFSNVDGAVFQVLAYSAGACGAVVDGPETTAGGSATFTVDTAGTFCIQLVSPPPGYELSGNSIGHFPGGIMANKSYADLQSGWSVTFAAIPVYSLPIFKEDLSGNLIDGAGFTLYDATGATVIRAEQFVGDASAQDGSAGRTIFEDLPAGSYLVVESTVPNGYLGADAQLVSLPENTDGWTFKNTPLYDLPIFKENDAGERIGGAGFTLYDAAGTTVVRAQQFVADATAENLANGSAGRTIFEDLPAGTYVVVETTVPANHDGAGPYTVSLPDNTTGWTFVNDRNTGNLLIDKRFCEVFDPSQAGTHFGETVPLSATECVPGAASFLIYPFLGSEALGPYTTDAVTGEVLVPDLPVGTHGIEEIGTGATTAFSIVEDQTTELHVQNHVYNSGSLEVIKYFCKAKHEKTIIEVNYPVDAAWRHDGKDHDCWTGKAHFEVWLFGNKDNAIKFHTGWHEGIAWLTLPVTDSSTGPHILVETETGAKAEFHIAKGEITSIVVTNFVKKDKPDKPEPPVTPEEEVATIDTLPATGTGSADTTGPHLLAAGGIMLLALGALKRRRSVLG